MPHIVVGLEAGGARDVVYSADQRRVFVSTANGNIDVFSTLSGAKLASWHIADALGAISLSEDGSYLLAADSRQPLLYKVSTATGAIQGNILGQGTAYIDIEIVDATTAIATGSRPALINLVDGTLTPLANATYYSGSSIMTEDSHLTLLAETGISNGPLFLYDDRQRKIVASGDSYQSRNSGFNYGVQAVSETAGKVLQFIYYSSINVYDLDLKYQRTVNLDQSISGLKFNASGSSVFALLSNDYRGTGAALVEYDATTFNTINRYSLGSIGSTNSSTVRYGNNLLIKNDATSFVITNPETGAVSLLALVDLERRGTEGADRLEGSIGNDFLSGNGGNDFLDLSQGGNDRASGGAGDDGFYLGGALTVDDVLDGGEGSNDQVALQGDYTGARRLALATDSITGIEVLAVLSGADTRFGGDGAARYSYDLTSVDANVAAGAQLVVTANSLRVGENLTFNGSAETDGTFLFYAGRGNDVLTGGAKDDGFYFGASNGFGSGDRIDGGGGSNDQVGMVGTQRVTFGENQLTNVEVLVAISATDRKYGEGGLTNIDLTLADGNIGAGQMLTAYSAGLVAGESMRVDASRESDGRLRFTGGAGDDIAIGGSGDDSFYMGLGTNRVEGGRGADAITLIGGTDTIVYAGAADSNGRAFDSVSGFDFAVDRIDLAGDASRYHRDADLQLDSLSTDSLDADLSRGLVGRLDAGGLAFVSASGGTLAGSVFLVVDQDGQAGYTPGADLVIRFDSPAGIPTQGVDFII